MKQNHSCILWIVIPFLFQQQTNAFSITSSRGSPHIQHSITTATSRRNNLMIRYAAKESITNHTILPDTNHDTKQPFDEHIIEQELAGFKSDLRQQSDSSSSNTTPPPRSSSSSNTLGISETTQKLEQPIQNILYKLDTIHQQSKIIQQQIYKQISYIYTQIFSKDFGKRGEEYLVLQFILGFSVIYGKLPLLQTFISILFGPLLLSVGVFCMSHSCKLLYRNQLYTSFVIPSGVNVTNSKDMDTNTNTTLTETLDGTLNAQRNNVTIVMNGMYQHVRHPIYASTVAIMVGYSTLTKSAMRLLYTFAFYKIVEKKAMVEEKYLMQLGDYASYKRQVKDAFFPLQWMLGMWNKVNRGRQGSVSGVVSKGLEVEMEDHHKVPRVKGNGTVASKKPMEEVKETTSSVAEEEDSDKVETSLELKQEKSVKAQKDKKDIEGKDEKDAKEKDIQKNDTSSKNGIFSFKNNKKNSKGLFP